MSGCASGLRPGRLAHDLTTTRDGHARAPTARVPLAAVAAVACVLALAAGPARAANVRLFHVPTPDAGLSNIVAGPDGALWFNELSGFSVGEITTAGAVTELPVPRQPYSADGDGPSTIVASGANLWTLANVGSTIDEVSPAGTVTPLYANLGQPATSLAPDGRGGVWAASAFGVGGGSVSGGLFRVDPPTGILRTYRGPRFGGQFEPLPIVAGRRGTAWFADGGTSISRIDGSGRVVGIRLRGSGPMLVTSLALDGAGDLWFTEYVPGGGFERSTGGAIGEIPAGSRTATLTRLPGNQTPGAMILGRDGGIWFTWARGIGRIAPATGARQLVTLGSAYRPTSIAFGGDGNLWFVDPAANAIGRIQLSQLATGRRTPVPRPVARFTGGPLSSVAASRQLTFSCRLSAAARCAVTATLSAATAHRLKLEPRGAGAAITLGTATRTLRRRGTATLAIKLSPAAAAAFARAGVTAVTVTVTAQATSVTGHSTTVRRTITLRR